MTLRTALARAIGDHRHNVVSIDVDSPRGEFCVQFTENRQGERYWNVCDSPPPARDSVPGEFVNAGPRFELYRTETNDVAELAAEYRAVIRAFGGPRATIQTVDTYYCPPAPSLRRLARRVKETVVG